MNPITKRAIAVTHDPVTRKFNCGSVREFWERLGRPDLIDEPASELPPVYLEALHIVQRKLRDGADVPERPKPLRAFLLGAGERWQHWTLRPTKGWLNETISRSQAMFRHEKYGIRLCTEWPS